MPYEWILRIVPLFPQPVKPDYRENASAEVVVLSLVCFLAPETLDAMVGGLILRVSRIRSVRGYRPVPSGGDKLPLQRTGGEMLSQSLKAPAISEMNIRPLAGGRPFGAEREWPEHLVPRRFVVPYPASHGTTGGYT